MTNFPLEISNDSLHRIEIKALTHELIPHALPVEAKRQGLAGHLTIKAMSPGNPF